MRGELPALSGGHLGMPGKRAPQRPTARRWSQIVICARQGRCGAPGTLTSKLPPAQFPQCGFGFPEWRTAAPPVCGRDFPRPDATARPDLRQRLKSFETFYAAGPGPAVRPSEDEYCLGVRSWVTCWTCHGMGGRTRPPGWRSGDWQHRFQGFRRISRPFFPDEGPDRLTPLSRPAVRLVAPGRSGRRPVFRTSDFPRRRAFPRRPGSFAGPILVPTLPPQVR